VRTSNGATELTNSLGTGFFGTPHRYRIDWSAGSVAYFIDGSPAFLFDPNAGPLVNGVPTATSFRRAFARGGGPMRTIAASESTASAGKSSSTGTAEPYAASGAFMSRVFDAGVKTNWQSLQSVAKPSASSVAIVVRTGNSPIPDGTWSGFGLCGGRAVAVHPVPGDDGNVRRESDARARRRHGHRHGHGDCAADPPVADSQSVTTNEDTAKSITLTAHDPTRRRDLQHRRRTEPWRSERRGAERHLHACLELQRSGQLHVQGNDGVLDSSVATVSIAVTPVNDNRGQRRQRDCAEDSGATAIKSWQTTTAAGRGPRR